MELSVKVTTEPQSSGHGSLCLFAPLSNVSGYAAKHMEHLCESTLFGVAKTNKFVYFKSHEHASLFWRPNLMMTCTLTATGGV